MKYAVLAGGTDGERPISLKSGKFVFNTLQSMKTDVVFYILPDQIDEFLESHKKYDLVFPMFHGSYGEDGVIFEILSSHGIPHTHSDAEVHKFCFNKQLTKLSLQEIGIPIAPSQIITQLEEYNSQLVPFPIVIKPNTSGSSLGVHVNIKNYSELQDKWKIVHSQVPNTSFIIEKYLSGEEYSVPVMNDGGNIEVLPTMQVILDGADFFDYQVKYEEDGGIEIFPDDIDPKIQDKLNEYSRKIHKHLDLKTLSRCDFIVQDGTPHFLEINTVPGFSKVSIFPRAWRKLNRSNKELIQRIIQNS